ncbi:MAG TPA: SDR family NAD(P)-dependent oxidoreductase [Jatrophihabitans sp.]|jgi:NADP-dependent 3-hydroxy acid dehydrogenase YdfG
MSIDLRGNVALITGASSGIGEAISLRLAELGASVVLVSRHPEALTAVARKITEDGGHALTVAADVTDLSSIQRAVGYTINACERLDIVVASAGTADLSPFAPSEPGSWQQMIDINVSGLINTAHAALRYLLDAVPNGTRGVADLVAISSTAGRRVGPAAGVYAATKHAVGAFGESLRQEVAERSVRVGLVEPGFVDTPLTSAIPVREQLPFLRPEDVVDAVEYMICRPAGTSINEITLRATHQVR